MNEQQEFEEILGEEYIPTAKPVAIIKMASGKQLDLITRLLAERGLEALTMDGLITLSMKDASSMITKLYQTPKVIKTKTVDKVEPWGDRKVADIPGEVPEQGTFTVVFPSGDRRTVRFHTATRGSWKGKTVAQYLYGSDNNSDYKAVGHSVPGGIKVWGSYKGEKHSLVLEAIKYLLQASKDEQAEAGKTYALASGNCYVCNRTLTDPVSITLGIGPVCRSKEG